MSRAGVAPDHCRALPWSRHRRGERRLRQHKYEQEMRQAFEALAAQIEHIVNPPGDRVSCGDEQNKKKKGFPGSACF